MSGVELSREERDTLIVQLREEGLSLSEVGKRVGLSGTRVSRILNGVGTPLNPEGISPRSLAPRVRVEHRCATPGCGATLKAERWVYSPHTGHRYCYPNEGCWTWSEKKRRQMREAHALVPSKEE